MMQVTPETSGFGRAWFALTIAFALHVLDEATTGFLNVYNPTVTAMRARFTWFPMPTFEFREWIVGLIAGVVLCFALTPLAERNARWLRPLAWFYALVMFFNGMGHTAFTILGAHGVLGDLPATGAGILFVAVSSRRIGVAHGASAEDGLGCSDSGSCALILVILGGGEAAVRDRTSGREALMLRMGMPEGASCVLRSRLPRWLLTRFVRSFGGLSPPSG